MSVENERFEQRALAHPNHIAVLRTAVVRLAEGLGASAEVCEAVQLAVSEALTNVAMHAYLGSDPGDMTVEAWLDEEENFVVHVLDEGHGLVPRPDSPGLGIGLGVMARIADDCRIGNRADAPGTKVSLRFSLGRSRSRSPCRETGNKTLPTAWAAT